MNIFFSQNRNSSSLIQNSSHSNSTSKFENELTKTLMLIMLSCIVCWAPFTFGILFLNLRSSKLSDSLESDDSFDVPLYFWVVLVLPFLNSAIDPLIYAFRIKAIRKGFQMFNCRFCRCCCFNSVALNHNVTGNSAINTSVNVAHIIDLSGS